MNKLDQAREQQSFHADIATQSTLARQRALSDRERLIRALGSRAAISISRCRRRCRPCPPCPAGAAGRAGGARPPHRPADRPHRARPARQILRAHERHALRQRAGRRLCRRIKDNKDNGEHSHSRGFAVSFEIPVFDFGETRVREAEQAYLQAANRLAEIAVNVRSQARDAYRGYRGELRRRRALPARDPAAAQGHLRRDDAALRRHAGRRLFPLLADARQRIAANAAAVDALRDFWLASANLAATMAGGASAAAGGAASTGPQTSLAAADQ